MHRIHYFLAFLTLLGVVSCGLDAHYVDGYIHTESVQRAVCKSISGDMKSKLYIFYADTSSHWKPVSGGEYTRTVVEDSIVNYSYTIGDYGNQYVVFPNIPISLLGKVVTDDSLSQALLKTEPKEVVMKYQIGGAGTSDDHKGVLSFQAQPLFLTLKYGGKEHLVGLYFDDSSYNYAFDADNLQPMKLYLSVSITSIKVDDVTVQQFDDWKKNASEFSFIVVPR